uniref:NADH dehydrogenase [ubiquinone] 1 alpha subcomplex assembly factor 3 n=1 Tax=Arcella intermedia TaxID=1963864 RepID=A0A6B2LMI6_9EUKA
MSFISKNPKFYSTKPEPFDRSTKVINPKGFDAELLGSTENLNVINGYNDWSFHVKDVCLCGSIMVFPEAYFLWRARKATDITIDSLKLISTIHPTPSYVLVGTGENQLMLPSEVVEHYSSLGITLESLSTPNACSTFNFLLQERRPVALAALTLDPDAYPLKTTPKPQL